MLSIRAPSTWSKSVSLIAFWEMLFQPFLRITGRLKKVIDLVDLFFKQGQIFALSGEILDHLHKGFFGFPLVIAIKTA